MESLVKSRWDIVFVVSDIDEGAHLHGTISRGTDIVILIKKKYGDEDMEVRNRKSKRKTNKQKTITNQNHMDIKLKIMLGATFSAYCICKKDDQVERNIIVDPTWKRYCYGTRAGIYLMLLASSSRLRLSHFQDCPFRR